MIVELDNVRRRGRARALTSLTSLAAEIARSSIRVEVIIGTPGDETPRWVADLVRESGLATLGAGDGIRILPVGELRYYAIKNQLARQAQSPVIVFLDSDAIAQPGWLRVLMNAFEDPEVAVVAGRSRVGPLTTYYDRFFAATWIFDPEDRVGREAVSHFFANNVAFRADVFARYPFPDDPQLYRGACTRLAQTLQSNDIPIVRENAAEILHPPLVWPVDLVTWFLLNGRDFAVERKELPDSMFWAKALKWVMRGMATSARLPWARRRACGLGPAQAGGAAALAELTWVLRILGVLIGRWRPALLDRYV